MRKILSFFVVFSVMLSLCVFSSAEGLEENSDLSMVEGTRPYEESVRTMQEEAEGRVALLNIPSNALEYIFYLLDNKDYETYASLTDCVAKEEAVENGIQERRGFFNLQSVSLTQYKDITGLLDAYTGIIEIEEMKELGYSDIHVYTVELDCQTYSEDKYFFNGLNHFMAAIGTDGTSYKLLQFSQPLWSEIPEDARFLGIDETAEIFIQNERLKGNIIGANGNLIETNRAARDNVVRSSEIEEDAIIPRDAEFEYLGTNGLPVKEYLESLPMPTEAIDMNFPTSFPSTIRVFIVSTGRVETPDFVTYCKKVLSKEWTSYQIDTSTGNWYAMPDDAFSVGAICVKQFGWWRIHNAKYAGQGFDVKSNRDDQDYDPSIRISYYAEKAYNSVEGMAIANSNGKMFLTQYRAGEYNANGKYESLLYQNGAAYLCIEKEFDKLPILNHYYGYCTSLGGDKWVRFYYY